MWAENKINELPSPNFISASENGVAVSWGNTIYLLDHTGHVTGKEILPEKIKLTQLKLIDNEIWIGDVASKCIYKVKNAELKKVLDGSSLIRNVFKFALNKTRDRIYVTDSSNHKGYIYDYQGRLLKNFGKEGKAPAELKFPNSILFTEDGNLLIVNTNAHRLDIYSTEGDFIKTFANVESIGKKYIPSRADVLRNIFSNVDNEVRGKYEWPTLLTLCNDKAVFLLAKNGLENSKLVVYDNQGRFSGELAPTEPLRMAGDVASWGDNVLVTDRETRKIHLFKVENMSYIGEFSQEMKDLSFKNILEEKNYKNISCIALVALLLVSVPIIILLMHQRRREAKGVATIDIKSFIPSDAIWTVKLDKKKLQMSIALMGFVFILLIICLSVFKVFLLHRNFIIILLIITILYFYALMLLISSGYLFVARRPLIEKMLKEVFFKHPQLFQPDEVVACCTALQSSLIMKKYVLLIMTNRQLFMFDIMGGLTGFTLRDFSRYAYRNIKSVSVEKVNMPSKLVIRSINANMHMLRLSIEGGTGVKEMNFYLAQNQILDKIKIFLEQKRSKSEFIDINNQKVETVKAIHPGLRGKIETKKWIAPVLSAIFPGLGQFYNRQILKGTIFSAAGCMFIIILIRPLMEFINKNVEYSEKGLKALVIFVLFFLLFYLMNIVDAYFNSKKESL
ncbi:MAG: hypothetical protein NTW65_03795 [Deltaproteobacteria bacterium]|nr:hypothetical protein [Deltaproteobacteria bacterium]